VEAESTVGRIGNVSSRISSGLIFFEEVNELTPSGWSLFSFVGEKEKPNQCAGENCLCICDEISSLTDLWSDQIEECSESGACAIIKNLEEFSPFEIGDASNPTSINISKSGDLIEVKKI
jgi:hypothetical protein